MKKKIKIGQDTFNDAMWTIRKAMIALEWELNNGRETILFSIDDLRSAYVLSTQLENLSRTDGIEIDLIGERG